MRLIGTSVIVVGAGLAGLTAAARLTEEGFKVTVVDARSRVGGRVLTLHDAFAENQHAEAGGDFIDEGQSEIIDLVKRHGLTLRRVLRRGFSFVRQKGVDQLQGRPISGSTAWNRIARMAKPLSRRYRLEGQGWNNTFARKLARRSVREWLDSVKAGEDVQAVVRSLRGFFLADPEDLSLLVLVEQLALEAPGRQAMYRIDGGSDR